MNSFQQLAISVAHKSPSRFRLGAVLVKRRRVVSVGFNIMNKTHPKMEKFNQADYALGLHAEIHACLGVPPGELRGATIYVARLLKSGEIAVAAPCRVCGAFMESVGIRSVSYTTDRKEWFEFNYK